MRPEPREIVGVVVGRQDFGEVDRVVRLLTPDAGVVAVFATGARRARSPYAGLDLGARVRARVREGRGDLARLAGVEVEDGRVGVRRALGRMVAAAYACEVCGGLGAIGAGDPRLFGLLETALLLLDASVDDPAEAFLAGVEAKALTFAGFAPVLDRCAACGKALEEPLRMDPLAGGAVHAGCVSAGEARREAVSLGLVRALEDARRTPLRELLDSGLPPGPVRVLGDLVEAHLGRALVARRLLDGASDVVG